MEKAIKVVKNCKKKQIEHYFNALILKKKNEAKENSIVFEK